MDVSKFDRKVALFAFDYAELEQNEKPKRGEKQQPCVVRSNSKGENDEQECDVYWISGEAVNPPNDKSSGRLVRAWMRLVSDELSNSREENQPSKHEQPNAKGPTQRATLRKKREAFEMPSDESRHNTNTMSSGGGAMIGA